MATVAPTPATHSGAAWRWCLASALRTGLACAIIGCLTLYGPSSLRKEVAFPAFSYANALLIVNDATLGDTFNACWLVFYATFQSMGPAILSLWLIGPARLTSGTVSLAVALGSFVVALPEGTHLLAKRIALGQIVIVYVVAYNNGDQAHPVMHPLRVAASTAVGVLASILALTLPFPRLACWEVKGNCKLLAENISERLKLYMKAFCEEDSALALSSISQAKRLATAGTKFLQNIKRYQVNMKWERLPFKFLGSFFKNPGGKLQEMEIPLKGMEMALTGEFSFPVKMIEGEKKESLEEYVSQTLNKIKNCLPCDSATLPESKDELTIVESLQTIHIIPKDTQDLSTLFFIFCMKLFHCKTFPKLPTSSKQENELSNTSSKQNGFLNSMWSNWAMPLRKKRLIAAMKCSLSLALAVLFGSLYSKENNYWSGLQLALSLVATREPTFKIANIRAQGTVLGTVYALLCCFIFQQYQSIRFLSLLPWFIFTTFLKRSKMYGQAGGISATLGAVLILGRKNFGTPSEFAIARIAEVFIGLSCSIVMELVVEPTRAASLAKVQLTKSLRSLSACIDSLSLEANSLIENQKRLKFKISKLDKFTGEAEVEPNFWFLPFHSGCYCKLIGSLSNMVDLLVFSGYAIGFLEQESQKLGASWKEYANKLNGDVELFKEMVGSLVKCLEDVTSLKSLTFLDEELERKNVSYDSELGKSPNSKIFKVSGGSNEGDEIQKIMHSYLQHAQELVEKLHAVEDNKEEKSQILVLINLGTISFCMNNLIKEVREIENKIQELVQWENPGKDVNLYEISCKIRALAVESTGKVIGIKGILSR